MTKIEKVISWICIIFGVFIVFLIVERGIIDNNNSKLVERCGLQFSIEKIKQKQREKELCLIEHDELTCTLKSINPNGCTIEEIEKATNIQIRNMKKVILYETKERLDKVNRELKNKKTLSKEEQIRIDKELKSIKRSIEIIKE